MMLILLCIKKYLIKCLSCGIEHNSARTSFHKFCSNKCQREYEFQKNIEGWLEGLINPLNTNGVSKPFVRKYLFKRYNNKCVLCGWSKRNDFTGKIPLEVDHVDGNYKNNKLENLRLLCPNCHSLTKTYKNLNRGKGRSKR